MKLVKVGALLAFVFIMITTVLSMVFLPHILNAFEINGANGNWRFSGWLSLYDYGDNSWEGSGSGFGFGDHWDNYGWNDQLGFRSGNFGAGFDHAYNSLGERKILSWVYVLIFAVSLIVGLVLFLLIYRRAQKIEEGLTQKKGLLYVLGGLMIFTGLLTIPGILVIAGALLDTNSAYNNEVSRMYDGGIYEYNRENPDSDFYDDSRYSYHPRNIAREIHELREDLRDHRYDVDDELEYMNRRNNRKFEDIERDIDDLYQAQNYGRRRR